MLAGYDPRVAPKVCEKLQANLLLETTSQPIFLLGRQGLNCFPKQNKIEGQHNRRPREVAYARRGLTTGRSRLHDPGHGEIHDDEEDERD
ncbi:hypothetical protein Dimus_028288 [Dionaea muscipula]